ncbi:methylated-DNA--[protein]-cysteine S-methyltransferase [Cryptosporangium aurantiacum]|uniref:Methylated-DNA-[protein]-cysteine S-methyltransferase n=1 Tax=Cryptosporangium aurantiacum TaxID=134849 RepID=A0A1M7QRG9_9ACTN|nr:methylated-DNA--[protein]-cysteine S-methyltransferase [Cryptosporangium aurantiacum]SHN34154.1 methylated-DNA-[protein]-cysteine S-methyltransferase [Cryptosporangium aurantiacum]
MSTSTYYATVDTPIGPFTAIESDGTVLASGWTNTIDDLLGVIHPTLRPIDPAPRSELGDVTKAVLRYHEGDVTVIDTIPVRQRSGPFLLGAWEVLRKVQPGSPVTYTEYAELAGRPLAVRAAASACARNAAALFVPCHRVLRSDGTLGGFRWGVQIKRWLLDHEA